MPNDHVATIKWRIEAVWPLARYGTDTPFRVPGNWLSEGSGAGFGQRDAAWYTKALLTRDQVEAVISGIERPADVSISFEPLEEVDA